MFSFIGEILCKVVNFCPVLVISSSIFTLVTVSFERRQVIIDNQGQGQDSRRRITKRKLIAVIFIIWTLAAAVSVPTYLEYTVQELEVPVGNTTVTVLSCGSQFSRELALANAVFGSNSIIPHTCDFTDEKLFAAGILYVDKVEEDKTKFAAFGA